MSTSFFVICSVFVYAKDVSGTPPLRKVSSRDHLVKVCPNSAKLPFINTPSVSYGKTCQ